MDRYGGHTSFIYISPTTFLGSVIVIIIIIHKTVHTWSQNKEITPDEYARLKKMGNIHPSDSQVLKKKKKKRK